MTGEPALHMPRQDWLELLPEAALLVDAGGTVIGHNGAAAALLGSDDRPSPWTLKAVNGFSEWLDRGDDTVFRSRLHVRRATGVPLTVELSARRRAEPGGGAVCMILEPDRERVAVAAQRYFDTAFSAAPIGMALFNTDGEYVRVNAALCELLGRTETELLGRRD